MKSLKINDLSNVILIDIVKQKISILSYNSDSNHFVESVMYGFEKILKVIPCYEIELKRAEIEHLPPITESNSKHLATMTKYWTGDELFNTFINNFEDESTQYIHDFGTIEWTESRSRFIFLGMDNLIERNGVMFISSLDNRALNKVRAEQNYFDRLLEMIYVCLTEHLRRMEESKNEQ